jgi:DNA invertase Pin-like site-specific DNA recombinase
MMSSLSRVAVYARVSTLLGQDPENQLIPIRELASNRKFDIVEEFVDIGVSGSKDKRPALDRLLKAAKQGKFKFLVIYSIDRLGRSTKHLLTLIEELKHLGISIISIREALDFSTPVGQMSLTVLSAVAQLERELISERIKTALAVKKKLSNDSGSGWKCGRPALSQEIEEKILELRSKGLSVREISKALGNVSKSSVSRLIKLASQKPSKIHVSTDEEV